MIDIDTFVMLRGHPSHYYNGIWWFIVDKKQVQIYARSWNEVQTIILAKYPSSKIKLLVK